MGGGVGTGVFAARVSAGAHSQHRAATHHSDALDCMTTHASKTKVRVDFARPHCSLPALYVLMHVQSTWASLAGVDATPAPSLGLHCHSGGVSGSPTSTRVCQNLPSIKWMLWWPLPPSRWLAASSLPVSVPNKGRQLTTSSTHALPRPESPFGTWATVNTTTLP